MSSGERIDLPSGESLWYFDEDHSYWRHNPKTGQRGRRLTGVTTAVKTLDHDPSNLLRWAAKTQCVGVADLFKLAISEGAPEHLTDLSWLSTDAAIWRTLQDHSLTFEDVRNRAAKRGTNVHEVAFQALGMGRPVPDLDLLTEEEKGHAKAVMAFWLDHEPKPRYVEQIVYSERLGIAGRLDFLGELKGYDGLSLVDAKTGRFISAAAHAQVGGGYPLLAAESGLLPLPEEGEWLPGAAADALNCLILQTREDGTYELIEAQATTDDFEGAVATYRAAGRINGAAGRARDARRTERRLQGEIDQMVDQSVAPA